MMIKSGFRISLYLSSLLLLACSHHPVSKPDIIQDAEGFTHDGIQAFAEADQYRAKRLFNRALFIYEGIDHQKGLLETHINLAEIALSERDYLVTQQHLQRATARVDSTTLQPYQTRITLLYAQTALQQKHYSQALNLLQVLLPEFNLSVPVGIPDSIQLTALANRTKIAFAQRQNERLWTQRYTHALRISKPTNPNLSGRLLRFQAQLAQQKQNYQHAETLLHHALTEYKKNLARTGIAATLSELGQLHTEQERWQDARNYLDRSRAVLHSINDLDTMVRVTASLIKAETKLGHIERSQALNAWLADIKNEVKRSQ